MIERIVAACCRNAYFIVLTAVLVSFMAGNYAISHFEMDTDTTNLVAPYTAWRQRVIQYDKLFPEGNNLLLIVVDGVTPERAEYGAATLAKRLSQHHELFLTVRRPDATPFFTHNGMLFLSTDEVRATTDALIRAQPFLGPLAADPSLRGILKSLDNLLKGVAHKQASLSDAERPMTAIAKSLDAAARGRIDFLSWRSLFTGTKPRTEELRKFIEVQPRLNFKSLRPALDAAALIRSQVNSLNLVPAQGIRVRLTGPVMLGDEDFASLQKNAGVMALVMVSAVLVTLLLAVQSFRIVLAIVLTVATGFVMTTAAGLLYANKFNSISIAFIALFIGLGVDFAIQFAVRYRAERYLGDNVVQALSRAGGRIGLPLALAAAAIASGFYSFFPTNYSGVAELGVVSGTGMLIAFGLSITLLPAILSIIGAPGEPEHVGFRFFVPVDDWLHKHRRFVLSTAMVVGALSIVLIPFLRFDSDPLQLRNPKSESVSTLRDLMTDSLTSPNVISVLAPSLSKAGPLADRIRAVPGVGTVLTLMSFIPRDQPAKLALIEDADTLLDETINPFSTQQSPSDADVVKAMRNTATSLRAAAATDRTGAGRSAIAMATALEAVVARGARARSLATDALVPGVTVLLNQIRNALTAQRVTLATLPDDLKRSWIAVDGTARIEVHAKDGTLSGTALRDFTNRVQAVAPTATGAPIMVQGFGATIVNAFVEAGLISAFVIAVVLTLTLRSFRDVTFTMLALALTALLTLSSCVILGLHLNFANIIALPLLLGVGVAFNIYFITAWRSGERRLLTTSLTRAVIFSAMTTGTGFGSLWISTHPGTASLGQLLMLSLFWTLVSTLIVLPAALEAAE